MSNVTYDDSDNRTSNKKTGKSRKTESMTPEQLAEKKKQEQIKRALEETRIKDLNEKINNDENCKIFKIAIYEKVIDDETQDHLTKALLDYIKYYVSKIRDLECSPENRYIDVYPPDSYYVYPGDKQSKKKTTHADEQQSKIIYKKKFANNQTSLSNQETKTPDVVEENKSSKKNITNLNKQAKLLLAYLLHEYIEGYCENVDSYANVKDEKEFLTVLNENKLDEYNVTASISLVVTTSNLPLVNIVNNGLKTYLINTLSHNKLPYENIIKNHNCASILVEHFDKYLQLIASLLAIKLWVVKGLVTSALIEQSMRELNYHFYHNVDQDNNPHKALEYGFFTDFKTYYDLLYPKSTKEKTTKKSKKSDSNETDTHDDATDKTLKNKNEVAQTNNDNNGSDESEEEEEEETEEVEEEPVQPPPVQKVVKKVSLTATKAK